MSHTKALIVLKGEIKTKQIVELRPNGAQHYHIVFNSGSSYRYHRDSVLILETPRSYAPSHCQVFLDGKKLWDLEGIWRFGLTAPYYWRIAYSGGKEGEYPQERIRLVESCLVQDKAMQRFDYLRDVASYNALRLEEDGPSLLYRHYERIDFIAQDTVAALYLGMQAPRQRSVSALLYPFGCNASQGKALDEAMRQQLSVIQGPPGTGKTQTILNIIANAVMRGESVLLVSNNNSATSNVADKLRKHGLDFIVAPLGKHDNKTKFIEQQPSLPSELPSWHRNAEQCRQLQLSIEQTHRQLQEVYSLQEMIASTRLELDALSLEYKHFSGKQDVLGQELRQDWPRAEELLALLQALQWQLELDDSPKLPLLKRWLQRLRWWWQWRRIRQIFRLQGQLKDCDGERLVRLMQEAYYQQRLAELERQLDTALSALDRYDVGRLRDSLEQSSMELFRAALSKRYSTGERTVYSEVKELSTHAEAFVQQYPVVLSTTFSARQNLGEDFIFDYLIMDEASQVSVETGFLALCCARRAVIVGDTLQLPNVLSDEDRARLRSLGEQHHIDECYDASLHSFLSSVCATLPQCPETLLREHYRCHPQIINYCNQRFYAGQLLIMTERDGCPDTLSVIQTVAGHHARQHYNQREIDVIEREVLPKLNTSLDLGIITPYNKQVEALNKQLPDIEAATVHKYQGRERDIIIMSTVDDNISPFADDPNLLNVAISRAKRQFVLVMTGNEQTQQGNLTDLVDYIRYNQFEVRESALRSVFDYMYESYTAQRISWLSQYPEVSEYLSENLCYALIKELLASRHEYTHLSVLCHYPLQLLLGDSTAMSEEERSYALHPNTHLDFLIINRVSKRPVLAVEVDGYHFHQASAEQTRRDKLKDAIAQRYGLCLLRLPTNGHSERKRIDEALSNILGLNLIRRL